MNKKFGPGHPIFEFVTGALFAVVIIITYIQAGTIRRQNDALEEAHRKVMDIQATCFQYEMEIMSLLGPVEDKEQ